MKTSAHTHAKQPRKRKWFTQEIALLDPVADSATVMLLIVNQLLPRYGGAMLLNAIYSIGTIRMCGQIEGARALDRRGTGKIIKEGERRAHDTVSSMTRWIQHGPLSAEGMASLARVKRMHDHFAVDHPMSNETFVHTIAYFVIQFDRLFQLVGAREFTDNEKLAQVTHWRFVGEQLGTRDLPQSWEGMEQFVTHYEACPQWYGPTPEAHRCAVAVLQQFCDRRLPIGLKWLGRVVLLSLSDDHVLNAVGLEKPPKLLVWLTRKMVCLGLFVNYRLLPDRSDLIDPSTLVR